jgi:hypothetical protein
MKKVFIFLVILVLAISCKKHGMTPEGPTDIRVKNLSDMEMTDLKVNTSGGENNYGVVAAGATTDYYRFDKAYPKANISAVINGQTFKTDSVKETDYLYYQYLGPVMATYEIYIENVAQKKLKINNVVMESAIK